MAKLQLWVIIIKGNLNLLVVIQGQTLHCDARVIYPCAWVGQRMVT